MLIFPQYPKIWRNKAPGLAQSRSNAGYFLRAVVKARNTQSTAQINWRHIFGNTRRNWTSLAEGNQGYNPVNGIPPQTAWEYMNDEYFGILLPGYIEGIAQLTPQLSNCQGGSQYYQMAQTLWAALHQAIQAAPALNDAYLTSTTTTASATAGAYTTFYDQHVYTDPDPLEIDSTANVSIMGSDNSTWTVTIADLPAGVNANIATPTFSLIYNATAGSSNGGTLITFTIEPNTAPATATALLNFSSGTNSSQLQIPLTITQGAITPVTPPPTFGFPATGSLQSSGALGGLVCRTVYDDALNVIDFELTYKLANTDEPVMQRWSKLIPNQWVITASAPYTNAYSPPPASQWLPITYNGYVLTNSAAANQQPPADADGVLASLEKTFGPLPQKGEVKFMAQPVDPISGATGPAVAATASFETGTMRGANHALWRGNNWAIVILTELGTPATITGNNPYSATFTGLDLSGTTGPEIYYTPSFDQLPPVGPCATTITNGNTLTFTAPAGAPPPTTTDIFLWIFDQTTTPAPGEQKLLLAMAPAPNTGQPTGDPWGNAYVDSWPTGYTFPRTFSLQPKAETYYPNGTAKMTKVFPPDFGVALSASTLTFETETDPYQWVVITTTALATTPSWEFLLAIEATDGVFVLFDQVTDTTGNATLAPPPQSYLTMDKETYVIPITGAGTYNLAITLSNSDTSDYTVSMLAGTQSIYSVTMAQLAATPYTFAWDNQQPDVPAAVNGTPGTITVNCQITVPANITTDQVQIQIAAVSGKIEAWATVT